MADTFTVYTIMQNDSDIAFKADVKAYLDTLTAANIDIISFVVKGQQSICYVVSHA